MSFQLESRSAGAMVAPTEEIWGELCQSLAAFVRKRVDNSADAEDIVQDVFLRIHRRLDTLRTQENLRAWVYRITQNAIIDHFRRQSTTARNLKPAYSVRGDAHLEGVEAEAASCLIPLAKRLPEPYREAVLLTDLGSLTQKDAARQLGLSFSGMKSRVQRGREKLKNLLLECCHVELDRLGHVLDYRPRDSGSCGCRDGGGC